jgi:DNA polymerase III subunit beta
MKATCNREDLLAAFQMVSGVVPARSPKPILLNVKLVTTKDAAVLLATDLEVGIRCTVAGVDVQAIGEVVLPTSRMLAILRESSDATIELESDENQTAVRGQRSRFKLAAESPQDFPEVPVFTDEKYHTVPSTLLRTMIRRTVFATDVESTRYALNGLLVELEGNRISLVGTDGRRLAVVRGTGTAVGGHSTKDFTPVVPSKAMNLIDRTLQTEEEDVFVALHPNKVLVRTQRAVISSRLVEGRFPRYQEVFPSHSEVTIPLNVRDLLQATRQAAIVTSEESRGVDFTFSEGKLTLAAHAAEVGQSQVELPISYNGKELTITFDPRYLVDMLRVLNEESNITVDLIDHQSAAVFKTDDGYTYIVMPLTRDR